MSPREPWRAQRFYRDTANGKVMGVCAGIADYYGWNVTWVRVIAIVALLWLNVVTLIAYVALGMLWPVKPSAPTIGIPARNTGKAYAARPAAPSARCASAFANSTSACNGWKAT